MSDPGDRFDPTPVHAWLIEAGLAGVRNAELLDGFCRRLREAGFPLTRGYLSVATLHPLVWATGTIWHNGLVEDAVELPYGYESETAWLTSPFRHMLETRTRRLHRRLAGKDAVLDFPVLREFHESGLTEWVAFLYRFEWPVEHQEVEDFGVAFSWATDRPDGWEAAELSLLEALSGTLALAVKGSTGYATARDLLATYVGRDAAHRVAAGQVQRGSVSRIAAFILYADLRGFTAFADLNPPEEVIRRLNGCFDCIGAPVKAAGGDILKFIGDGVLAVFLPGADDDHGGVAAAALRTAREVLERIERLNAAEAARGHAKLSLDIALHQGELTYGNIGTADRLDFTVIGPAVNEASRLEALCKSLGLPLLVSESFVRAAPSLAAEFRSLGHHRLPGVRELREVFTPAL